MMTFRPEDMTLELALLCEVGGMWEEAATIWTHLGRQHRTVPAWRKAAEDHQMRWELQDAARCCELAGYPGLADALRAQDAQLRREGASLP
jgi:hypothetical protein